MERAKRGAGRALPPINTWIQLPSWQSNQLSQSQVSPEGHLGTSQIPGAAMEILLSYKVQVFHPAWM